ncbi:hypothetical protein [uncultured Odoribacter sp.]|uniref:hypothetical protein n=1 Tax=uncultured Odoribacter sp. TaxID=876416 RepID=UPI002607F36C|nr:hypothetical protein [uncultured Odoribacter sp.]
MGQSKEYGYTDRNESRLLSEMLLGELWQLFPIVLTRHNASWTDWYNEEAELLYGNNMNTIGIRTSLVKVIS